MASSQRLAEAVASAAGQNPRYAAALAEGKTYDALVDALVNVGGYSPYRAIELVSRYREALRESIALEDRAHLDDAREEGYEAAWAEAYERGQLDYAAELAAMAAAIRSRRR